MTTNIVKFWRENCSPCSLMRPAFTSLKRKYSGKANFYCVSKNTKGITVVPTFLAVIDGKEVGRLTGYVPYDELESFITKWLS